MKQLLSIFVRFPVKKMSRLVVATLGLELDPTARHDTGGEHVAVKLLLGKEMSFLNKNFVFIDSKKSFS